MKKISIATVMFIVLLASSCKDLSELNENPNELQAEEVNLNLVLSSVLTEAGILFTDLGVGDVAGVMQHTQKDGWFSSHNSYDWSDQDWSDYYAVLTDNELVYELAVEEGYEFQQGVALVMRSMVFGLITDLWGDAPYSEALQGEAQGTYLTPAFDEQEDIYTAILADLETANTLLSKDASEYTGIVESVDVYYSGDPTSWRKLANSLALRYYMRISTKSPSVAQAGIEKIAGDADTYPIITTADADATMGFSGTTEDTSWPTTLAFDTDEDAFSRFQMAATLVEALQALNDPRLGVYAAEVEIPLVVDSSLPEGTDEIVEVDGKEYRYLAPDVVDGVDINTDPEYVGLPTAVSSTPVAYNLNPNSTQGSYNPHVSQLNDIYKEASGDLLLARLMSAAEVNFILAEAAQNGWSVGGDAATYYYAAIESSLEAWGLEDDYDTYIQETDVVYDGTLEQLMQQKWIASWTAATESWFDYRRTGYPALTVGNVAKRQALPVRFYYGSDELSLNEDNANEALARLEVTTYSQSDGENSAWSKSWLLQDTGLPWE